jgi:hypothetical protein
MREVGEATPPFRSQRTPRLSLLPLPHLLLLCTPPHAKRRVRAEEDGLNKALAFKPNRLEAKGK